MGAGSSSSRKEAEPVVICGDHEASINCMAMSEDYTLMITGADDGVAKLWATHTEHLDCVGTLLYKQIAILRWSFTTSL